MTIHTSIDPRRLQELGADVAQLTRPIQVAIRGRVVRHPALLDGLRQAARPGQSADGGSGRRGVPGSRPPLRLDPLDALTTMYVELSGWHARLELPSPPRYEYGCDHGSCREMGHRRAGPTCAWAKVIEVDWQKTVLRQLVGAAPNLAPAVADWLITDVHGWWSDAAAHTDWRAADLRRLR